jgi:predicted peptidase
MKTITLLLLTILSTHSIFGQDSSSALQLKTANNHPMQYFVSLPKGWNKSKKWPVVMILEAADKEYKTNAERFLKARGETPVILVAPYNTNNGNSGRRDEKVFPYSKETWDYIEKVGDCQFNDDGIHQIIQDVSKDFSGEEKIYLTGFEAGAHALWSIVFNHPEYLKAAIPVAGNFRNRCIEPSKISKDSSKKNLPIHSIVGEEDDYFSPLGKVYNQWIEVKTLGEKNGFSNISETVISKKGHVPMPEEVLNYINSLQKK